MGEIVTDQKFGLVKSFFKNQIIFREGQAGNVGYLIKTGKVDIYKIIDGEKKVLNSLGPGEVFGEISIVTESARTAFAEAVDYCDLVVIDRVTLMDMLKKSPKLIQSITLFLMKRLAGTLQMLDHQEDGLPSQKKILSIVSLLDLASEAGADINYNEFSQRAMDIAPISQPEIDRIIRNLVQQNIIEVWGEFEKIKPPATKIKILDTLLLQKKIKQFRQALHPDT